VKPLREATIEDEWEDIINKSYNLPCEEWENMMKARANVKEEEAEDLKSSILESYDWLISDLKEELINQGYRPDIVEKKVELSAYVGDILKDNYYKALGEATGINSEEDIEG